MDTLTTHSGHFMCLLVQFCLAVLKTSWLCAVQLYVHRDWTDPYSHCLRVCKAEI